MSNNLKKQENQKQQSNTNIMEGCELWTDGLICAFEFVQGRKKTIGPKCGLTQPFQEVSVGASKKQPAGYLPENTVPGNNFVDSSPTKETGAREMDTLDDKSYKQDYHLQCCQVRERSPGSYWVPIGWVRISELVQIVQVDAGWASQATELSEDDVTVADVAAPYWERPKGPTWWCHVMAGHPFVNTWFSNAQWLHPAVSVALRDESKLISERMKHLLYEVPVRVSGGLLFELLGQSAGDPLVGEDDIPIVLRSWQAQNFLVTALHVKGYTSNINVLGIAEVQELLAAGGYNVPLSIHEVIAFLACRLAKWDDRLFRKSVLGEADEIELKFMNRRTHEDMQLISLILNQEIRRLSTQDQSLKVNHNLAVFGGCGLVLTIITGLFGINVDGMPWSGNAPYAFALFSGLLILLGIVLIAIGLLYLGLRKPITEEVVEVRKLELQELVSMFQLEAETHAQVRKTTRTKMPSAAAGILPDGAGYVLISRVNMRVCSEASSRIP